MYTITSCGVNIALQTMLMKIQCSYNSTFLNSNPKEKFT